MKSDLKYFSIILTSWFIIYCCLFSFKLRFLVLGMMNNFRMKSEYFGY